MKRVLVVLVFLMAACSQGPAPGVIAVTNSFELSEDEVAPVAAVLESVQPSADREGRIETLRRAARSVAIERLVVGSIENRAAIEERYAKDLAALRRDAVVGSFLQAEIYPALEVDPTRVDAYIEEHSEDLSVQGVRLVSHIYRRYQNPGGVEEANRVLEEIAERARGGEAFGLLAEEYSQSESRSAQGRLGWIGRGRLAAPVEEAVFALEPGEISAPVDLGSGAAIFRVTERIDEREFRAEDVRPLVERRLMIGRANEAIRELLPDDPPGEDWIIIDSDQVLSTIPTSPADDIVVRIDDFEMSAGEFRSRVTDQRATDLRLGPFDISVIDAYDEVVLHQLLYRHLTDSSGFAAGVFDSGFEEQLASREDELIMQRRAEELIRASAAADTEAIRRFFDANRHVYQTPLRLDLRMLSLPLSARPGEQVKQLEVAGSRVSAGKESLDDVAQRLGGRVKAFGLVSIEQLAATDSKIPRLVLDVGDRGTTVPFQLNRRLNLIEVVARQEPVELDFGAVRERVIDDYVHRHQQEIYAELVEELLDDAGFVFFEERAAALLDRQAGATAVQNSP